MKKIEILYQKVPSSNKMLRMRKAKSIQMLFITSRKLIFKDGKFSILIFLIVIEIYSCISSPIWQSST